MRVAVAVADVDEPIALDPARPLVPDAEELAKLPAAARAAFLARCGQRVAPLRNGDSSPIDPPTAAALVLAAARVGSPIRRQLRAIRKDYDRLKWFVRRYNWGDDTPKCIELLTDKLLPKINLFGYGQVESKYGSGQFLKDLEKAFVSDDRLIMSKIENRDKIMQSIKEFLGRGR